MPRRRYTFRQRTEEEKRNLKIDLAEMEEWQAELKGIMDIFERFDVTEVLSAASLVQDTLSKLFLFHVRGASSQRRQELEKFEKWKQTVTVDRLVRLSHDHSAPEFLRSGVEVNIAEEIRGSHGRIERSLEECRAKGVTKSVWVELFTSKVHSDTIRRIEEDRAGKLKLVADIPIIEKAVILLSEVLSESRRYASRVTKLKEMLHLAEEKKAAIGRFEAKHGKIFAKAAASDKHTRGRAASLKYLVKKTKECPYCGQDLGNRPHLDHIYPVSKGGLSIVENLVWCCSTCNSLKADKGLMQYLTERRIGIEETIFRLHSLGKHV